MRRGGYPPGAKNDPRAPYNEKDHTHEHRWRHEEEDIIPKMEDGAAIFREECQYAEGRRGDKWECEETRTYRFEYSELVTPWGMEIDLPTIDEWPDEDEETDAQWMAVRIEEKFITHGPGDEVSWDVDPDPEYGVVTIEWHGYTLRYEA